MALGKPLVYARRMKKTERAMNVLAVIQICLGIIMSSALLFCGTPSVWMSVAATVMQLAALIPTVIIYYLCMNKING